CPRAKLLAERGLTEVEIAFIFGVNPETLTAWQRAHKEFLAALQSGKEDVEVEAALYQCALGYATKAVKIFRPPGAKEPVYAPYTIHHPGHVGAQKFWLYKRQPEFWRDKRDTDSRETIEARIKTMTPAQRRARLAELNEKAQRII